jgi:hypothetical protein
VTGIEEPILYIEAQQVSLAKAVLTGGTVQIDGQGYVLVNDADAYTQGARWLYLKFFLDRTTFEIDYTFRQHGVFTELVPAEGHESDPWLEPGNVSNVGIIERISNHTHKEFGVSEDRTLEIILEFR